MNLIYFKLDDRHPSSLAIEDENNVLAILKGRVPICVVVEYAASE
jgi:hypothetical protein